MTLAQLESGLSSVARGLALLGFAGLLLLASMTTLDVLLRWLFSAPIQGVNDVSAIVMAVVIASCIPANLATRQNIQVEILGPALGPAANRFLRFFSSMVTLAFIVVLAWKFIPYTEGLMTSQRRTWVLGWTIWPWWAAATLFLWCAVAVQILVTLDDAIRMVRGARHGDADSTPDNQTQTR
ncbi:MAG: TRAP transporter small permease [Paracoccus sp. (in: a-proteobacteria)]